MPALTVVRRAVALAAVLGVVLSWMQALTQDAFAVEAVAVRMGDHGNHTRFVVDVSANLSFAVSSLIDPHRVVVDLPEATWKTLPVSGVGTGVVYAYRYDRAAAQIVLDLAKPAAVISAFMLPPGQGQGWRLVVDLAETTSEAFLNSQGLRQGSALDSAVARPLSGPGQSVTDSSSLPSPPSPHHQSPPPAAVSLAKSETAPGHASGPATPQPKKRASPETATTPPQRAVASLHATGPRKEPREAQRPMIVLDPGHGGADPGATGTSGIFEKHITFAIAIDLREKFLATGRYRIALTREDDIFIPLRERVASARTHKADLFISLHADAIASPEIRGLSVYTLSKEASDQEAAALAERENKADLIGGLDLSHESRDVTNILIDLVQRETMNHSARLASAFIRELRREVQLLPKTHRFAGFAVLKAPDVPAVLLEMGYLSNPEEEQLLRQPTYRAKLGSALVRAVDHYFKGRKVAQP
ncbi:MAG: N-acetylmuramoyl-L-alanine amidase [Rhodospirillaceae bacterium]|nr:MAG: N-acetylmuramoyl-L-alanine amidase [Rhodospirillaceae bacterium]